MIRLIVSFLMVLSYISGVIIKKVTKEENKEYSKWILLGKYSLLVIAAILSLTYGSMYDLLLLILGIVIGFFLSGFENLSTSYLSLSTPSFLFPVFSLYFITSAQAEKNWKNEIFKMVVGALLALLLPQANNFFVSYSIMQLRNSKAF